MPMVLSASRGYAENVISEMAYSSVVVDGSPAHTKGHGLYVLVVPRLQTFVDQTGEV